MTQIETIETKAYTLSDPIFEARDFACGAFFFLVVFVDRDVEEHAAG